MQALGYGMARDRFDGDDVVTVQRPHRRGGRARARNESSRRWSRSCTYRFRGHSMCDPGLYRTKDEVEEWKQRDPLVRRARELLERGKVDEKEHRRRSRTTSAPRSRTP